MKIQSRLSVVPETDQSQNYYNAPNGDPLAQQTDLDVFFNLYEPLNDAMDAARCMGSGFIARHSALADIGGWPLIDVGEDFMLSSCFHQTGWKTAYVGEKVQWGLAPESLCAHLKQKKRWVSRHLIQHSHYKSLTAYRSRELPRFTNYFGFTFRLPDAE
jgi:cellulose synthase/poly-beta-1,6-N-acetylglucosamine synthase-like glycosyltransferase